MPIDLENRLDKHADDVYNCLLDAHQGLDDDASEDLNARLVLLLLNQLGDAETAMAIIRHAAATRSC